ncbi:DEAD/DEAH box helicase family protein [Streptomyces griseoviridis]|uniref:DEAD/DEAH box helicase family protein n=1 Tax=Streptomyces griseoviridis TaxID=45398 RepID=UPI00148F0F1E
MFVTYQSLHKLPPAHQEHLLPRWDLIVVDEAHRTAGARNKRWGIVHDNDAIPARHRLYLTATRASGTSQRHHRRAGRLHGRRHPVRQSGLPLLPAQAIHEGRLADYRIAARRSTTRSWRGTGLERPPLPAYPPGRRHARRGRTAGPVRGTGPARHPPHRRLQPQHRASATRRRDPPRNRCHLPAPRRRPVDGRHPLRPLAGAAAKNAPTGSPAPPPAGPRHPG